MLTDVLLPHGSVATATTPPDSQPRKPAELPALGGGVQTPSAQDEVLLALEQAPHAHSQAVRKRPSTPSRAHGGDHWQLPPLGGRHEKWLPGWKAPPPHKR